MSAEQIAVLTGGGTFTVTLGGPTVYSDSGLTQAVAMPATVSADTTWYAAPRAQRSPKDCSVAVVDPSTGEIVVSWSSRELPGTIDCGEQVVNDNTASGLSKSQADGSYAPLGTRGNLRPAVMLGVVGASSPVLTDFTTFNTAISPRSVDMLLFQQALGTEVVWYGGYETMANQLGATICSTISPAVTLSAIAGGTYDTYLATQAATVKAYKKPVILRMAHEFNLSGGAYGNTHETAAAFVSAWQYIVNLFRADGATNALWFWCPNCWFQADGLDPTVAWYPGDDYVDIVGVDGYSYDANPLTPAQLFSREYASLTAMTDKPFMIGEFGCGETGGTATTTKANWYNVFADLIRDTMPRLIGLSQWQRSDGQGDYTISTSGTDTAAAAAFVSRVTAFPFVPAPGVTPNGNSLPPEPVASITTSGSAQTIATARSAVRITLTANCTITMPAAVAGTSFPLTLIQDGTGSRTVTWTTVRWPGGTAPTLSTAAASVDQLVFSCTDGTHWDGFVVGLALA